MGTFRAFVDVALRDAIEAGVVRGPGMMCAGAYVTSPTGGGDIAPCWRPTSWCRRTFGFGVANSVDEVRRAVREILHGAPTSSR